MRQDYKSYLSLLLALCFLTLLPTFAYCKQIQNCQMEMDCCDHTEQLQAQISETPCCDETSQSPIPFPALHFNISQEMKDSTYFNNIQTIPSSFTNPSIACPSFKFFVQLSINPSLTDLSSRNLPLLC